MLSGLPPSAEKFLIDINRLQQRNERAQQQITSGLKLSKVSDGPDDISRLLSARAGLDRVHQVQLNLGRVKVEVDSAENALGNAVSLVERARVLASQGSSGQQDAPARMQIAGELQGILERLVSVASTAVEGRYIFSGDNDQVAPYALDPATPGGVTAYQGSVSTREVADASGLRFSVAQTADNIFDSADPETNVFQAVNGMRRALLAVDNPPDPPDPSIPSIEQAMHNLGAASIYLNQRLAGYGLVQNRVAEAGDTANKLAVSWKQQVSSIQDADLAEAATELTQSGMALEAAFSARAKSPRRSLFDYLG
ncbi:MAG: hypothetical protein IANPNBLG_01035 [Bryobacteraceae bacterium]|nr:hypothetical protein [Bryobacteraceae bacterium]